MSVREMRPAIALIMAVWRVTEGVGQGDWRKVLRVAVDAAPDSRLKSAAGAVLVASPSDLPSKWQAMAEALSAAVTGTLPRRQEPVSDQDLASLAGDGGDRPGQWWEAM